MKQRYDQKKIRTAKEHQGEYCAPRDDEDVEPQWTGDPEADSRLDAESSGLGLSEWR
jgi:hypothetical protein